MLQFYERQVQLIQDYIDRIAHIHLKDVRPKIIQQVKENHLSFLKGVKLGAFTVPGDGCIDFKPIFDFLGQSGYTGWLLVEAEQDPKLANPLVYATKGREIIRRLGGI